MSEENKNEEIVELENEITTQGEDNGIKISDDVVADRKSVV